jgi:hypothetical protein
VQGYSDGFFGFWGDDVNNQLYGGDVGETYPGPRYDLTDGTWNYQGGNPSGTWDCSFLPSSDTCNGSWEDVGALCTDGDLWGNIDD